LEERDPLTQVGGRRGHRLALQRAALRCLALVAEVGDQLPEGDHGHEDEPRDEHREHDLAALGGGIRDERERSEHRGRLYPTPPTCARWRANADSSSTPSAAPRAARSSGSESPRSRSAFRASSSTSSPSTEHVAAQTAQSPAEPVARAREQSEISSARSRTAAVEPVAETRTRPCA